MRWVGKRWEMKQEDFEAKREKFLALLAQVANTPRPFCDYSTLSNATLAGIEFLRRLMEVQGFFMAHYRVTGRLPTTKKEIDHILVASINLTTASLAAIYCACSDVRDAQMLRYRSGQPSDFRFESKKKHHRGRGFFRAVSSEYPQVSVAARPRIFIIECPEFE